MGKVPFRVPIRVALPRLAPANFGLRPAAGRASGRRRKPPRLRRHGALRPVDLQRKPLNAILLVRLALSCVLDHGFAWFSAGFVPKLFPSLRSSGGSDRGTGLYRFAGPTN